MEFHEKLQKLRKERGLTQEELARALYVSRTAVSKWESNRGYPGIDSLKAISKFFSVSVDELLSGDEVLTIAEEEGKTAKNRLCDLVFGLLDCSTALFLVLPIFGQKTGGGVYETALPALTTASLWLKTGYLAAVFGLILWGILTLALQNCAVPLWQKNKRGGSLALHCAGALLFILGQQPYAAAFLFVFLLIKGLMLGKTR